MSLDSPPVVTATAPAYHPDPRWQRVLRSPESTGVLLLALALLAGVIMSASFWDPAALLYNTSPYVEIGLIALPMTLVIINGDIDLSVASMLALSAAVLGALHRADVPLVVAIVAAILTGTLLGLCNGLIVTRFGLPSLVVTLGTLALFQGFADVILTDSSVSDFPDWFVGFDQLGVFGSVPDLPMPLLVLLLGGVAFWFLLHRTSYGQLCFLVGSNPDAARYSGIRTGTVRIVAFVMSGAMSGLAAVLMTSRLGSTQSDFAVGLELTIITVVVLGGTDIFGGRGSVPATVIAFFTVVAVRQAMSVASVNGQSQNAVIGCLLVASLLVPALIGAVARRVRRRRHTGRPGTPPHRTEPSE